MRNFGLLVAMTMIIGASAALTVIPALLVSLAERRQGKEKRSSSSLPFDP
jgi:predicted RND superfamily exporter protein